MPLLSRTQAAAAGSDPAFVARVKAAMLDVAVDVHGGSGNYSAGQYAARSALASQATKYPSGYASVFAATIAANEWTDDVSPDPWVVPGAGNGSDPLIDNADGDFSLRLGVERVWDTIADTPTA